MATPGPPPLVMTAGPPLLGFFFNLLLSGVLAVQVCKQIYPFNLGDRWGLKALVYGVFVLEVAQTVIQCHDKFELYAKEFGDVANLEKQRLSWFAIPVLTSFTGGIVQAFLGWRIFTFSRNWFITIGVWTLTLLATGAGMAQGIISTHLTIPEVGTHTETTVNIWFITTAVNDLVIAGILTYYLNRMKTGVEKTDKLVSRIIKLTVETGSVTGQSDGLVISICKIIQSGILLALSALLIVITFFTAPPWFLMVMFNRRLTIGHNPSPSEISGDSTQLSTFRTGSLKKRNAPVSTAHTTSTDTEVGSPTQYNSMDAFKPRSSLQPVRSPVEWTNVSTTGYVHFDAAKDPETPDLATNDNETSSYYHLH
ncbi:hypothetical protein DL96DRAFT_1712707 [Flagelloscypha sp. PMI_526]|nr:hypothetical protein DL96DRAFT_1712707 [Flagelloscypha sp. PMI_526]